MLPGAGGWNDACLGALVSRTNWTVYRAVTRRLHRSPTLSRGSILTTFKSARSSLERSVAFL